MSEEASRKEEGQLSGEPANDDVKVLERHVPGSLEGSEWSVFGGHGLDIPECQTEADAYRAADEHAKRHDLAVWLIRNNDDERPSLLNDYRKPNTEAAGEE